MKISPFLHLQPNYLTYNVQWHITSSSKLYLDFKIRAIENRDSINDQLSVPITSRTCFSKVRFSLAFYRRNIFFPMKSIWNSFHTLENPNFVWRFRADGSKFQLDPVMARSIIIPRKLHCHVCMEPCWCHTCAYR